MSTYSVVVCGVLMISISERSVFYTFAAAVLCAAHALLVGPPERHCLARDAASVMALLFFVFSGLENWLMGRGIITCMGHFLIAVMFIKLYERKPIQGYRLIQIGAVLLMTLSAATTQSMAFLPAFVLCAASLIWNSTVCEFHYGLQMAADGAGEQARAAALQAGRRVALLRAALTMLAVFLCTAILFVLFPRFQTARPFAYAARRPAVVGFGHTVSLDVIGRMIESDELVMQVGFSSPETHEPVVPSEVLMRGRSLERYEGGRWHHHKGIARGSRASPQALTSALDFVPSPDYLLRGLPVERTPIQQDIRLEPIGSSVLFGLYRPTSVEVGPGSFVRLSSASHEIQVFPELISPLHYFVQSMQVGVPPDMLRKAGVPDPRETEIPYLEMPEAVREELEKVAGEIQDLYGSATDYDRVLAVMAYLEKSGRFAYTLDIPDPGGEDPLVAFLSSTRRGTCAHFATAMAMLLRVWDIPTRLVMGFKDGTPTSERGTYVFRQKDAHAWVEVRFDTYGWLPFDPSPLRSVWVASGPGERPQAGKGILARLETLASSFRARWLTTVIDYDYSVQKGTLLVALGAARKVFGRVILRFRTAWSAAANSGITLVGVVVSLAALAGVFLYLAGRLAVRKLRSAGRPAMSVVAVDFYRDLVTILEKKGLRRPGHLTAREFAQVAAEQLSRGAQDPSQVAEALRLISEAFYRVRFGARALSTEEKSRVRRLLQVVEACSKVTS